MSTTVSKGGSPQIGRPGSRTDSPMDPNNSILKPDDIQTTQSEPSDGKPIITTATISADASQNLSAPRRPETSDADTADYFSASHFSLEPNPFEQSFGNPSVETPGKSLLPPVAALTSPAIPGASTGGGFNWENSLRAGPLSPAMLAGPAGPSGYFDTIGRFPTPNESSLRSGLTPGGGGSMFPAPSPGGQSLLQQLPSGGATPSTLDFHRTAVNAARKNGANAPTSNPQEPEQLLQQPTTTMDIPKSGPQVYPFAHPDATDAANGLFMLAKGAQASNNNPFAGPTSQPIPAPNARGHSRQAASINSEDSVIPNGNRSHANGDISDSTEGAKPNGRGKGKKAAAAKASATSNGRRKAEDAAKGSNKKLKSANGASADKSDSMSMDDEESMKVPPFETGSASTTGNKKMMTDEEKKKNFKERNRVAALKCRQRRKQWVNNLQAKVDVYSTENEALNSTVNKLREEIMLLKSVLMAHKDCSLSQSQGIGGGVLMNNNLGNEFIPPPNWQMRR